MLKAIIARVRQGHRTVKFPAAAPVLPDRFRGLPTVDASKCVDACRACADVCPTGAIEIAENLPRLDLGRCLFCGECEQACAPGALTFGREHSLAARRREDLIVDGAVHAKAEALEKEALRLFGRSLKLRQVSAGGVQRVRGGFKRAEHGGL